jgi:hypothetical protein
VWTYLKDERAGVGEQHCQQRTNDCSLASTHDHLKYDGKNNDWMAG